MKPEEKYKLIKGDALQVLKGFSDESVDCVITSPPYWQLRNYGWNGQWGLEKTYMEYLEKLFALINEIKRILKPTGTVWVNLGDTYFGSGNDSGKSALNYSQAIRKIKVGLTVPTTANNNKGNNLKNKCLALIPHRFAIGCVERGWIVRNDIIWAKPNSMPESVTDRFSKKHEYIFFLTKSPHYYFDMDSIREPHSQTSVERSHYGMSAFGKDPNNKGGASGKGKKGGGKLKKVSLNPLGKNPGTVSDFWKISTRSNSSSHYAAYNTDVILKPVLAGCPPNGIILDPFCGTSTTGVAALQHGRRFVGIDGKEEYIKISEKNLQQLPRDLGKASSIKKINHNELEAMALETELQLITF